MESSSGGGSTATGGSSGNSFLPWHLIPSFKPGETEINEYTRRLEFLANIWPPEHLPQLAPRACMLCEGTAFAKVVRLDPEKLRVSTTDGVKLVVKTLGGVWGNLDWKRNMKGLNVPFLEQFKNQMKLMPVIWPGMKCNTKI